MKNIKYILIFTFVIVLVSCSDRQNNKVETMSPLMVEIPIELQSNTEVVKFIRASEKSINEFANKIEKFYMKNPDLLSKEAEEMSMVEKLKVMKVAGEISIAFGEFSLHYAEMNSNMENYEALLDEEQVAALATVGDVFEERMKLLEYRLENIKSLQ